jgi:hypothetical protein
MELKDLVFSLGLLSVSLWLSFNGFFGEDLGPSYLFKLMIFSTIMVGIYNSMSGKKRLD